MPISSDYIMFACYKPLRFGSLDPTSVALVSEPSTGVAWLLIAP